MQTEGSKLGYLAVIGYLAAINVITIEMTSEVAGEIEGVALWVVNAAVYRFVRKRNTAIFKSAGFGVVY